MSLLALPYKNGGGACELNTRFFVLETRFLKIIVKQFNEIKLNEKTSEAFTKLAS